MLSLEVVLEGDSFHVFLNARRDLRLVAPRIQIMQVRSHGGEELYDLILVRGDFFRDGGWERGLELADSRRDVLISVLRGVRGYGWGRTVEGRRC